MSKMPESLAGRLSDIQATDLNVLRGAHESYGESWKKRGGVGAFMMLARKWDRIEQQMVSDKVVADRYDVLQRAVADGRAEGLIDDIRDLRQYLLLVEAELIGNYGLTPQKLKEAPKSLAPQTGSIDHPAPFGYDEAHDA